MKSKRIIIPFLLIITHNVFAKPRPVGRPKDSQRIMEEISVVSYTKCRKDILDLKDNYDHFNEINLKLDKDEICNNNFAQIDCFSLPRDAPGLKEWSNYLRIPLKIENGRIGRKQICKILDGIIKNNQKLEISDKDMKEFVVTHYAKWIRKRNDYDSWEERAKKGIYELDFKMKEMEKLLKKIGTIYTNGIEVAVSKLCEYLDFDVEMKEVKGNEKFKEYANKFKKDLNAKKLQLDGKDSKKNCDNDVFSILLMANFMRAVEKANFGFDVEELQLVSKHLEKLAKNWFINERKKKINKFYEKNVVGKLNLILREEEIDWSSSIEKSISRSNSSSKSDQISDEDKENLEFSDEKQSKTEEMTMENGRKEIDRINKAIIDFIVKFDVKLSVKNALNFFKIANTFREHYSVKDKLVPSDLHKNFHYLVKEKWQEQIYEELKSSAEKTFKFLKLNEKNESQQVNFFFEIIMMGASSEIGKEIIEQTKTKEQENLKNKIIEKYGGTNLEELEDEFAKFSKKMQIRALEGAEHLAEHKFDNKIWENFTKNVLQGKFNVKIVGGKEKMAEVKIEKSETSGNRQMSNETKELFDKVDWNKHNIAYSDNSSSKPIDDFSLKNSELLNVDMKIPVRLNPERLSRLLKGLVKMEEKILEKWEKKKKEKKVPNLCKILHPKEEKDREGETVYPAYKTLLDLLSVDGFHDLEHGFRLIEVEMEKEKKLEIVPNKEDKRSTKNCKMDLAKIRAFMELAMSIHYSIDYQTISDNGAMARQIICENVNNYCDYPERIEIYRIGYGKVIKVLDIWLDKIAEWANFANKNIEMRFLVQIIGTKPPRFENQIGKNVSEYNYYPDHFIHPYLGLQKYCQHIIGVGRGEIENLSGYNFPAVFFFSPIPELNGAAQFAQKLGSFDFEWSIDDARTFYLPMEEIREKMVNKLYAKTDLCRMLQFHAAKPLKKILELKIVEEDFKYLRGAIKMYLHLPDYEKKADGKSEDPGVSCIYDAIILQGAIQIVQNMLEVMKNNVYITVEMMDQKPDIPELMKNYNEMTQRIQRGLANKSKEKFDPKAWDLMSVQLIWGKFHVIFEQFDPYYRVKVNLNNKLENVGKKKPISIDNLLPTKPSSAHSNEDKSAKSKEKKVTFVETDDDEEEGIILEWKYKDAVDFFIIAEELKKKFVKKFEEKKKVVDLCLFLQEKAAIEFWALLKFEKLGGMFKDLRKVVKGKFELKKYQQPEDAKDLANHPDNCIYDFAFWRAFIKIIEDFSESSKTTKDIEKRIFNGRGRTGGCEIDKYVAQSDAIKTWMKGIGDKKKQKAWKEFQSEWIMKKIHIKLEDAKGTDNYHNKNGYQKKKGVQWGRGWGGRGGRGGRNRNWNRDNRNWGLYRGFNNIHGVYDPFQGGIPPHQPKSMQQPAANAPQPQSFSAKPPVLEVPPVTHTAQILQPNGQLSMQSLKFHRDERGHTLKNTGILPNGGTFHNRYIQRDGPNILPMISPIGLNIPYRPPYVPPAFRPTWSMNPLRGQQYHPGFGSA